MDFLFTPITFFSIDGVAVSMHPFEMTAMIMVMLQIWLYGRLSLWGPILGGIGALMWITMGYLAEPTMWGLIILNIIILYLQVLNYVKWSRNQKLAAAAEAQGDAPHVEGETA